MTEQTNGNGRINEELFNRFMMAMVNNNSSLSRGNALQQLLDPRRNYDDEFGYPHTESLVSEDYKRLYDRNPIAARVVDVLPSECWQNTPDVYEDDDLDTETEFELAWDALGKRLRGESSWFQDQEGNPVWEYLSRADKLSRIGHFGIIVLGLNDGLPLSEPPRGFKESGSVPSGEFGQRTYAEDDDPLRLTEKRRTFVSNRHVSANEPDKDKLTANVAAGLEQNRFPAYTLNQEKLGGKKNELIYLRVFDESQVDIVRYEMNQASPRYGWPVEYSVCFNDPSINMSTRGGIGIPLMTQKVHWARVIHIADNLDSSELFGVPAQRPVLNNLLNIHKVYGGDAEGFYRGAIMSHSVETHPQLGPDAVIDWNVMRDQYEQFINGVQRIFGMSGAALKSHAPAVVDPTSHINIQIEAICIKLEMPKRVFMGSERGELASSQDKDTWGARKEKRRQNYITPRIIIPFIDRLIMLGVLPEPEGYSVFWPDTEEMTKTEKSAVLVQRVDAMSKYIGGGVEALMTPKDFLSREMEYTEEDADAILEAAAEATDEEDTYTPVEDPNAEPEPIPEFPPGGAKGANTDALGGIPSGDKMPVPVPSNNGGE